MPAAMALRSAWRPHAEKAPALRLVPNFPGREPPQSVPFGGKGGGFRKAPKARPKLTKLEKKALKWSRKHHDPFREAAAAGMMAVRGPVVVRGPIHVPLTHLFDNVTQPYIGQPATASTIGTITQELNAVALQLRNYYGGGFTLTDNTTAATFNVPTMPVFTANYTPTGLTFTASNTLTVNTTTTGTVTIPMHDWVTWNTNCTPATGWVAHDDMYTQRRHAHLREWGAWQGKGHEADLYFNPNDRLQRERIRRERQLAEEARYQQQRMERAAADAQRQREWEAGAPERERLRLEQEQLLRTAGTRAYDLLFRHLTDAQKNMLESENRFIVEGKSGALYEIRRGTHQNIYKLDDQGRAIEQLCCYPVGGLPEGDVMLGQMLHLMVNEEGFRRVANRWELRDVAGQQLDRRRPLTEGAVAVDRRAAA